MWFLKRPPLYPQSIRILKAKLSAPQRPNTRSEASAWCEERAVSTADAIRRITGLAAPESVRERFAPVFSVAGEVAGRCPGKMRGEADLDLLYWVGEYLQARKVIETGVAFGWSSLAILLSLRNREGAVLTSTDMPYPELDDKWVGCVVPAQLRSQWRLLKRADRDALPRALRESPVNDMTHYDSDKSYDGRMWAYPRLWSALRAGGIFISDDVGDNLAFRHFCEQQQEEPVIAWMRANAETASKKYVGVLVKNR